ncbi:hypothetical protein RB195_015848 [Necator americanus]|uniref:C2H2-type domain-containing protein n=1 Tax=Necator americanus TaxID=51031 RepID=A0ABR1E7L8_NECAM
MERFLEQLRRLQNQFDALNGCDHEDALAAVTEAVAYMRDATIRTRVEKEVELTLAWKAEKMIVERFAGDYSLMSLCGGPSTSFDQGPHSFCCESFDGKDTECVWSQSYDRGILGTKREELHLLESPESEVQFLEAECSFRSQLDLTTTKNALKDIDVTVPLSVREPTKINEPVFTGNGLRTGKENRFICATCGYSGNNRKALYRHGLKTKHLLRSSNSAGSLSCKFCSFRTNKTFNFNRHIKRFHMQK